MADNSDRPYMTRTAERRQRDIANYQRSDKLEGLRHTGRVLDNAKPYARQHEELSGIQRRIERIERGQEKP